MRIKNKRGITPIISVILLLMMTIAIAGLAYTWLQRMQTSIQSSSENTSESLLGGMNVNLRVEGYFANCSQAANTVNVSIYVRNAGSKKATNAQLYVGGQYQVGKSNASIAAGFTTAYTFLNEVCQHGSADSNWINKSRTIKITSNEMVAERIITFYCSAGSC